MLEADSSSGRGETKSGRGRDPSRSKPNNLKDIPGSFWGMGANPPHSTASCGSRAPTAPALTWLTAAQPARQADPEANHRRLLCGFIFRAGANADAQVARRSELHATITAFNEVLPTPSRGSVKPLHVCAYRSLFVGNCQENRAPGCRQTDEERAGRNSALPVRNGAMCFYSSRMVRNASSTRPRSLAASSPARRCSRSFATARIWSVTATAVLPAH